MDSIISKALFVKNFKTRFLLALLTLVFLLSSIPALKVGNTSAVSSAGSAITDVFQRLGTTFGSPPAGSTSVISNNCGTPVGTPCIHIVKTTNGFDNIRIPVGTPLTWAYWVTNDGSVKLSNIVVTDSDPLIAQVGTIDELDAYTTKVLTRTGFAAAGDYKNTGTATSILPGGGEVSDSDDSSYFGILSAIDIVKTTNGSDGPYIVAGEPVTWTYTVTNTGNVDLKYVSISDNKLGPVSYIGDLDVDQSVTKTLTGTTIAGAYSNIGSVFGRTSLANYWIPACDSDPSNYFGSVPGITIDKITNGGDGLEIVAGAPVTWTYTVTNTGNVPLTNVIVSDSDPAIGAVNSTPLTLAVGASAEVTRTGTAVAGSYSNTGSVVGTPPVGKNVTAEDGSSYTGLVPGISINKTTNGSDGSSILYGDPITWDYLVTNTGAVDLTDITVTDSKLGAVGTIGLLKMGESTSFSKTGTAIEGAYDNIGYVTGLAAGGVTVSDDDASNYFGANPSISIDKMTNGTDNPVITVGMPITWSYLVTNTGNIELTNIQVTDSDFGAVGTISSLLPGENTTFTIAGTAVAGPYTNIGTVVGSYSLSANAEQVYSLKKLQVEGDILPAVLPTVSGSDSSSYFGSDPAVTIVKTVANTTTGGAASNVATGTAGDSFLFTLVVTNTGNIALSNVIITDSTALVGSSVTVGGAAAQWTAGTGGIASLAIADLAPGQSVTITYAYITSATDLAATISNTAAVSGVASATLVKVTAEDTAKLSFTDVLGAHRDPTPTATPTTSPTATPTTSVLGASKTGETSNFGEMIAAIVMLAVSGVLLSYVSKRRQHKDDTHK